jgi:hypothetical protein
MDNIILAKDVIKNVREVLSPQMSYIVDNDPEVLFVETDGEFILEKIVFEATGEYQDAIVITECGIAINLEDGPYQDIVGEIGFEAMTHLEKRQLGELRDNIKKCVEKANKIYKR